MLESSDDSLQYQATVERLMDAFENCQTEQTLGQALKLVYFVEDLGQIKQSSLQLAIQSDKRYTKILKSVNAKKEAWIKSLNVGDSMDVLEAGLWCEAKILEIVNSELKLFKVHYQGWSSKYDTVVGTSRICHVHTFSKEKRKPQKQHMAATVIEVQPEQALIDSNNVSGTSNKNNIEIVSEPDDGGPRKRRAAVQAIANVSAIVKPAGSTKSKEKETEKEEKDLNDWICGICGFLEAEDGSDLVLCEGI
jgi:rubrerythrin